MSDELFVREGAPTLAGIKTGNLFAARYRDKAELFAEIRRINRMLAPKGLRLLPMRLKNGRALLYLFRPRHLGKDLENEAALAILKQAGYTNFQQGAMLRELITRLAKEESFPHEIGLFLSYPPEDVRGFIENRAANFKYSGPWKVYGDEAEASVRAARFARCTKVYRSLYAAGKSLQELAVSV